MTLVAVDRLLADERLDQEIFEAFEHPLIVVAAICRRVLVLIPVLVVHVVEAEVDDSLLDLGERESSVLALGFVLELECFDDEGRKDAVRKAPKVKAKVKSRSSRSFTHLRDTMTQVR